MKRLRQTEVERIAAEQVRCLICHHGERNLDRITLAIRRQARKQADVTVPQSPAR